MCIFLDRLDPYIGVVCVFITALKIPLTTEYEHRRAHRVRACRSAPSSSALCIKASVPLQALHSLAFLPYFPFTRDLRSLRSRPHYDSLPLKLLEHMASRSRGAARSAPNHSNQDADEERRLWKEIREKSASADKMIVSLSVFEVVCPCKMTMRLPVSQGDHSICMFSARVGSVLHRTLPSSTPTKPAR